MDKHWACGDAHGLGFEEHLPQNWSRRAAGWGRLGRRALGKDAQTSSNFRLGSRTEFHDWEAEIASQIWEGEKPTTGPSTVTNFTARPLPLDHIHSRAPDLQDLDPPFRASDAHFEKLFEDEGCLPKKVFDFGSPPLKMGSRSCRSCSRISSPL